MARPLTYILVIALSTYLVRVLPFVVIRRPIKSRFLRSFLRYVPYVTLSAMAFPDMVLATGSLMSGITAFLAASLVAFYDGNLARVTAAACTAVILMELIF